MKAVLFAFLSLVSLSLAAPGRGKRDAVTTQQLDSLKLYAQWSTAAYCNSEKSAGQPITCNLDQCSTPTSHKATVVASFIGTVLDMRGFVGVDPVDKLIVVSFRGSNSIRNWIANLLFTQVSCDLTSGCLAHTGFYVSWGEVAARVLAGVRAAAAANPTFKVVVTGHSLGGAVATLATAYIRKAGYAADLYTYGAPRVGNDAFVAFVTDQPGGEYRVTHTDDPVPRLPPIALNYRHTSPEYWIDEGSDTVVSLNEVQYCPGYSNVQCNGGTKGLDVDAHLWYFQGLTGCSSGISFKRDGLSDEELTAILNTYVDLDVQLAANLHASGQS